MPDPSAAARARRLARRVRAAVATGIAALVSLGLAPPADAEVLRVGAASSLREVVPSSARSFEAEHAGVRVAISYGATSVLAAQLRAGAPLDVLLSADAELALALAHSGLVDAPVVLARNRLVVVARPGLAPFAGPDDLAGPGVRRVAVPQAAVPIGRYARSWLDGRGLLGALGSRIVATEHARATLVAVDQGAADAAVVYATDAAVARRALVVWEIPSQEHPEILYLGAVAREAREPALARAFLALLVGGAGREHFARAGFAPGAAP